MKRKNWHLSEAIAYYQSIGAPQDQQALVELLHEVQREKGGTIPKRSIERIATAYDVKKSFLRAMIKTIPSLYAEDAPHTLEICGKRDCMKQGAEPLSDFIERTYQVRNGGVSETGGFCYHITQCLKKCGKGPVIRWDGRIYTHADAALIRALVCGNPPAAQREEPAAGRRLISLHGAVSVPPDVSDAQFFDELAGFFKKRKWAYLDDAHEAAREEKWEWDDSSEPSE